MKRRWWGQRGAVALALWVATLLLPGTAAAGSAVTAAASGSERAAVLLLLERFEATYQPGPEFLDAAWQVHELGRQQELEEYPRLSFMERAAWQGGERLTVDLDLSATWTLYRSNARIRAQLQELRVRMLDLEGSFARAEARSRFRGQLLELVQYRFLEGHLSAALSRTAAESPVAMNLEQALQLHQGERDLLRLRRHVEAMHEQVAQRVRELEEGMQRVLGSAEPVPDLPAFEELLPLLVEVPREPERCLARSPLRQQTELHHTVQTFERRAQDTLDLRVELQGSAFYRSGELFGSVGLELRLPLPSGLPVSGQLSLAADPSSVEQVLRLSWPPPAPAHRPVTEQERAEYLAEEREALEAEVRGLFRSLDSAREAVDVTELQLLWLVSDIHGWAAWPPAEASPASIAEIRALSRQQVAEPIGELQRVRHLSELVFAQLAYAEQALTLDLVCGGP